MCLAEQSHVCFVGSSCEVQAGAHRIVINALSLLTNKKFCVVMQLLEKYALNIFKHVLTGFKPFARIKNVFY